MSVETISPNPNIPASIITPEMTDIGWDLAGKSNFEYTLYKQSDEVVAGLETAYGVGNIPIFDKHYIDKRDKNWNNFDRISKMAAVIMLDPSCPFNAETLAADRAQKKVDARSRYERDCEDYRLRKGSIGKMTVGIYD